MSYMNPFKAIQEKFEIFIGESNDGELWGVASRLKMDGFSPRILRGEKMRTMDQIFDEFAAAFQFPLIFSPVWPAFDDCLRELDQFPYGQGVVVIINNADRILLSNRQDLGYLIESLNGASDIFAKPVSDGEWWDRPPVPFHVLFHTQEGQSVNLAKYIESLGMPTRSYPIEKYDPFA